MRVTKYIQRDKDIDFQLCIHLGFYFNTYYVKYEINQIYDIEVIILACRYSLVGRAFAL